ncbi:sigma-54-dependent transcriptional regulator [Chondrinema litorale]|uniref:sigma-54-dependent transcriptional regulator n=1 Tax=Chondrinema litorale TaxID=2994555 RepID=UPI0025429B5D|nr:sigma-54 dependent transcriptional regulator [Chondrinema litorale]UZR93180.1 sigma-54 dependent transcriptional regulator [Chondrinema litorale]
MDCSNLKQCFESDMQDTEGIILVVDNDSDVLFTASLILEDDFAEVHTVQKSEAAFSFLGKNDVDVVLLDMNFTKGATSGKQGLSLLEQIKEIYPEVQVIMCTAFGDIDLAVSSMQKGACDFVMKPWEPVKLISRINKALANKQKLEVAQIEEVSETETQSRLVFLSTAMQEIMKLVEKVAATESSVLILGENGTGKGLLAKEIHRLSQRTHKPFVQIDLGSLPASLFEAELFGHAKGAYTDAGEMKKGMIEMADGGTLFLDEIGNLPPMLQAKLLTVVQSKRIVRIGEMEERSIDFRLISATNMPLEEMMEQSRDGMPAFRRDLFFRINTVEIVLPPLRERVEDIPLLTSHILQKLENKYAKKELKLSQEASISLKKHSWPGNIRELEQVLERAVILSDSEVIEAEALKLRGIHQSSNTNTLESLNLEEMEKQAIVKLIDKHKGNMTKVAKELGVGRTTLYRRLQKYGL